MFSLFPNPAQNCINIGFKSHLLKNASLKITDIQGNNIYEVTVAPGIELLPLNLNRFSKGVYFVQLLIHGQVSSVKKLIIN